MKRETRGHAPGRSSESERHPGCCTSRRTGSDIGWLTVLRFRRRVPAHPAWPSALRKAITASAGNDSCRARCQTHRPGHQRAPAKGRSPAREMHHLILEAPVQRARSHLGPQFRAVSCSHQFLPYAASSMTPAARACSGWVIDGGRRHVSNRCAPFLGRGFAVQVQLKATAHKPRASRLRTMLHGRCLCRRQQRHFALCALRRHDQWHTVLGADARSRVVQRGHVQREELGLVGDVLAVTGWHRRRAADSHHVHRHHQPGRH